MWRPLYDVAHDDVLRLIAPGRHQVESLQCRSLLTPFSFKLPALFEPKTFERHRNFRKAAHSKKRLLPAMLQIQVARLRVKKRLALNGGCHRGE